MATTLRNDAEKPRPGPRDHLITLLRALPRDPTQGIEVRLKDMLQEFLQHRGNIKGNESTLELEEKCTVEASKHYYTILKGLITQESSNSGFSDISMQRFLESDLWQRCLVTCCLQAALKSNRVVSDVPLLLKVFKLEPYRFLEVSDKLEIELNKLMKINRGFQIRTKVLESPVWASYSGLWEDIEANGGSLPSYQQVCPDSLGMSTKYQGQQADLQPESDPESQKDVTLEAESSASADHQRSSSTVNRPEKKAFLHRFARMVYIVMGERLTELCSKLKVSDELRSKMWTCLEHCLVRHTSLMKDCHLDQLLISTIYIVSQVTDNKLSFEEIVKHYKFQPHTNQSVSEEMVTSDTSSENPPNLGAVLLTPEATSETDKRGSVINFYHLYSMRMQPFAKLFALTFGGETPPMSPFPPQQKKKSYRLHKDYNILISSLTEQTASPHTPIFTMDIGKSPREYLGEINEIVKKRGRAPQGGSRALPFDTDEGEDGPSSKQRCLDRKSPLQNRLMDVVKDREVVQNQGLASQNDSSQNSG